MCFIYKKLNYFKIVEKIMYGYWQSGICLCVGRLRQMMYTSSWNKVFKIDREVLNLLVLFILKNQTIGTSCNKGDYSHQIAIQASTILSYWSRKSKAFITRHDHNIDMRISSSQQNQNFQSQLKEEYIRKELPGTKSIFPLHHIDKQPKLMKKRPNPGDTLISPSS